MSKRPVAHETLRDLQRESFAYFIHEMNPKNGLVADSTAPGSSASIAATGMALTAYPVAVERGMMKRREAAARTLAALRFFESSRQSKEPDATGYKGFYYHFLDLKTGERAGGCELSTIDTTLLLAGALTAAAYFTSNTAGEREIGKLSQKLYERVDWRWACNRGVTVTHGWKPETGFLPYRWEGYCEGLLLYVLALASPTHSLPAKSYSAWTKTYEWRKVYDIEFVYAGPLFIHQFSHIWIDFRGIQDAYMRGKSIDYFENSRRATYAQREYAIRNPRHFTGYDESCWGISASDGPGPASQRMGSKRRHFLGYAARGIPHGPDDGTIAPWAAVASLPFASEIVLPVLRSFEELRLRVRNPYGFKATFNETFRDKGKLWISPDHLALNQGPVVLMIENYQSGLIWRLLRTCPTIVRGLKRAGFSGGWLGGK
jgi:hypothetical protein